MPVADASLLNGRRPSESWEVSSAEKGLLQAMITALPTFVGGAAVF